MNSSRHSTTDVAPLGTGFYTASEAARLLRTRPLTIWRWLGGYSYKKGGRARTMPPLWRPQLPAYEHHLELGFRDLIELRFVMAFVDVGLGLKTIRYCLEYARQCVDDERPLSTRRFRTDGRTIFLDTLKQSGESELLDLRSHQYALKQVIERTFRDLDISNDIVTRWRPFDGKKSIVIDPERAFGQPIVTDYGITTVALADAVKAEGSVKRVSHLFDVPERVVSDAVNFEKTLLAS